MIALNWYTFFSGLAQGLYLPVWILYLSDKGLNLFYIGLMGTVLETIRFFTEVPLGAFADCYGRKKSLYLGSLFMFLSMCIFSCLDDKSLIFMILCMVLMGIGNSFESGAIESWLAEYLIVTKREEELDSRLFKINILNVFGGVFGAVIVMIIFDNNKQMPFLLSSILFLINFIIAVFFIKEYNKREEKFSVSKELGSMVEKIKNSIQLISKRKVLLYFSISTFFYSWAIDGIERFYQTFLNNIGISSKSISMIFIISCIIAIVLMLTSERLIHKINNNEIIFLIALRGIMFVLILLSTMSSANIAYLSLILLLALNYLNNPFVQSYLNKNVSSDIRTTFLSTYELIGSCGEIFAGVSVGYVLNKFGDIVGIRLDGCIIILVVVFLILCIKKKD